MPDHLPGQDEIPRAHGPGLPRDVVPIRLARRVLLFQQSVQGTTRWANYEIPFYLKKGQRPDLIKLNLVVEGGGKIWIKEIELLKTPLG
jgi:hypothetical protein